MSTSTLGPSTSGTAASGTSSSLTVTSHAISALSAAFTTAAISSASRIRKRLWAGVSPACSASLSRRHAVAVARSRSSCARLRLQGGRGYTPGSILRASAAAASASASRSSCDSASSTSARGTAVRCLPPANSGQASSAGSSDSDRIPSDAAFAITSRLSQASSGRSTGSSEASSTEVMFGSVCDETWPSESPVTSAAAPQPLGERAADARHLAPVEHDPVRLLARPPRASAAGCRTAPPTCAPGRAAWKPFSTRACACAFVGRDRVEVRLAAEVQELDREAALHREQRRRPASRCRPTAARPRGRWCRPAARPRPRARARARRRASASSSTRSSSAGPAEVAPAAPVRSWIAAPISRSSCCEVSGKDLSRRRTRTAKVARLRARERHHRRRPRSRSASRSQRRHTEAVDEAEHALEPRRPTSSAASSSGTGDHEHRAAALDARVDARERRLQVAPQRVEEMPLVAPLERRLADLREHADRRAGAERRRGTPCRSGICTGLRHRPFVAPLSEHCRPRRLLRLSDPLVTAMSEPRDTRLFEAGERPPPKALFVRDLRDGQDGRRRSCWSRSARSRQKRNGEDYLRLKLCDCTGTLRGRGLGRRARAARARAARHRAARARPLRGLASATGRSSIAASRASLAQAATTGSPT